MVESAKINLAQYVSGLNGLTRTVAPLRHRVNGLHNEAAPNYTLELRSQSVLGKVAHWMRCAESPNDLKLSDSGVRRGTCAEGGKAAVEAGAVTHGAVRCSAWLGDVGSIHCGI